MTSRDKTRKRSYPGEREGSIVVSFLNRENEKILALLDLLKRLLASGTYRDGRLIPNPRLTPGELDQVQDLVNDFNQRVKRYSAHPMFLGPDPSSFSWRLEEVTGLDETGAALSLIDLAKMNKIDSLRQCRQCGKWFFAKFSHNDFCPGGRCQKEFDKNSPQAKKRRNDNANRRYWKTHPSRDLPKYRGLTWKQFRDKFKQQRKKKGRKTH